MAPRGNRRKGVSKFTGKIRGSRKDRIHRVRSRGKQINVPKLVYKFLGNVASLEARNDEETTRVATKSNEASRTSVKTSNSTICDTTCTPASSKSGIGTTSTFSIQTIKDYIRAGIAEGKRRAKKYMCKALSFGVDTGYLIPTDSDGQVLRVSSALVSFSAQQESGKSGDRGLRQKLRRGSGTCSSQERKLLRRSDPAPMSQKRTRSPSTTPSTTSSSKRSRPKTKKPKYSRRIKKHKSRKSKNPKAKRRPKSGVSFAKMKIQKSNATVKSKNPKDEEDPVLENLRKETVTPSRSSKNIDNPKSIRNEKLSDPSISKNSSVYEIEKKRN